MRCVIPRVSAVVVMVALAMTSASAAQAAEDAPTPTADVVAAALPHDPVARASAADRATTAGVGEHGAVWADTALGRVTLTPGDRQVTHQQGDLQVSEDFAARTTTSGATTSGAQSLAVLRSRADSTIRWSFSLPQGSTAAVAPDGGVAVSRMVQPGVTIQATVVDAPWAVDATGRHLPTRYAVAAGSLTQTVDLQDAVLPVTADPRLTYGRGVYLNMRGSELFAVGSAIVLAGGGAAAYACDRGAPGAIGVVVRVVCVVVGSPSLIAILQTIVAFYRSVDRNACYQTRILPKRPGWTVVNGKNC